MTRYAPLVRNTADFLEQPSIWGLPHLSNVEAASTVSFAADVSQYQGPLTSAYPWRGVIFRLGEGDYRKDARFDSNYAAAKTEWDAGRLDWFGTYHVGLKPGVNGVRSVQSQVDAVNSWIGGPLHPGGFIMQDAENWSGLQGGDLSAVFNGILEGCIGLVLGGDERRTLGYSNGGDWAHLWPTRPSWLKRTVASWGTTWPGTFGWQYSGATATPAPAGYPIAVAPWGAVDLNAFVGLTSQDVAAAFGIGADMTTVDLTPAAVTAVVNGVHDMLLRGSVLADLNTLESQIEAFENGKFAALTAALVKLQSGQIDVAAFVAALNTAGFDQQVAAGLAAHLALTAK
ncbi:MAG TPA: hypothetical protein VFW64_12285 [Pseudonocardiaceae bacterium]|nr:hypothetical protein [Pseudonocardiaceae bacterium]